MPPSLVLLPRGQIHVFPRQDGNPDVTAQLSVLNCLTHSFFKTLALHTCPLPASVVGTSAGPWVGLS